MKLLTLVFWISVAGIGIAMTGSIVTAFKQASPPPIQSTIPLPAEMPPASK